MLVNKFRVLTRTLETTSLSRAIFTFRVCCCLHNFIIDDRLDSAVNRRIEATLPNGHRLVQVPVARATQAEFAEVPRVIPGEELHTSMQTVDRLSIDEGDEGDSDDDIAPSREGIVAHIARSGYVRPRRYGASLHPYLCF